MKQKKLSGLIILTILATLLLSLFWFNQQKPESKKISIKKGEQVNNFDFLLEGYPVDVVPLYKITSISSMKYYVNKDPSRFEDYFGKAVNYYNVVFRTESNQKETLSYYRSLMSEQFTEFIPDTQVEGKIGKYKVSVSQYPDVSPKEIYLQVYMPQSEYKEVNRYQNTFPSLSEKDPSWVEYESGYGLLNQKGGEREWVNYYPLPAKEEEKETIINTFATKQKNETGYSFDSASGTIEWAKEGYTITIVFSKEHGRIYTMIRKPMEK